MERSMKWNKLHESSNVELYGCGDDYTKYRILVDKDRKVCTYSVEMFIVNDGMWVPQHDKTTPCRWSSKYGHWQCETIDIDIETAEFIVDILKGLLHE